MVKVVEGFHLLVDLYKGGKAYTTGSFAVLLGCFGSHSPQLFRRGYSCSDSGRNEFLQRHVGALVGSFRHRYHFVALGGVGRLAGCW
jgi:hypothetical protein